MTNDSCPSRASAPPKNPASYNLFLGITKSLKKQINLTIPQVPKQKSNKKYRNKNILLLFSSKVVYVIIVLT